MGWSQGARFLDPDFGSPSQIAYDGTRYFYYYTFDGSFAPRFGRYDPLTDSWTELSNPGTAFGSSLHASAYYNGKVYIFGANETAGSLLVTRIYDVGTDAWTTGANTPSDGTNAQGRPQAFAATVGTKIYVIGGIKFSGGAGNGTRTDEYDPVGNTWATKTAVPTGLEAPGGAPISTIVHIVGGRSASPLYENHHSYNTVGNSWTTHSDTPVAANGDNAPSLTQAWDNSGILFFITRSASSGNLVGYTWDSGGDTWSREEYAGSNGINFPGAQGPMYEVGGDLIACGDYVARFSGDRMVHGWGIPILQT